MAERVEYSGAKSVIVTNRKQHPFDFAQGASRRTLPIGDDMTGTNACPPVLWSKVCLQKRGEVDVGLVALVAIESGHDLAFMEEDHGRRAGKTESLAYPLVAADTVDVGVGPADAFVFLFL